MKYTTLIERYVIVKCRLNEARVRTTNSKGETKKNWVYTMERFETYFDQLSSFVHNAETLKMNSKTLELENSQLFEEIIDKCYEIVKEFKK